MSATNNARLIAFYLPQFHPIPENSQWWGPGFTDWNEVVKARPLFAGHRQPRMPRELGFYDLRLAATREAQARLAREHGIYGFCYYTYWLRNGKRLLEGPMEAMLRDGTPDFPFCVCWANENWTRGRDGGTADVLIEQSHSDADNAAFFEGMLPYFRDPRYIRIEERPLLLIYRPTKFPDAPATLAQWRTLAARHGLEPPYVVAVEHRDVDEELMIANGYDAVCEFPPIMPGYGLSEVTVATTGTTREFRGRFLDYGQLAQWYLRRPRARHRRFKGVTLSWDNSPRCGAKATILVNFSLERYREWLKGAIAQSQSIATPTERLVFINAWNEWAEGAYLEPDQQSGLGYLEATRSALLEPETPAVRHAEPTNPSAPNAHYSLPTSTGQVTDSRSPVAASRLRLVGISCVGNEADIVEAFVRHNLAFLDHLLVLEHNTFDGTSEILARLVAEGLPITVEHSAERQFRQLAFTNHLLRSALEQHNADWVFPIDCDEFLLASTRANLDAALVATGDAHLLMKWVNYIPSPGDDLLEPHPLRRIRHHYDYPIPSPADDPWVWKVAVNGRFLGDHYLDRYEIVCGSHFLVFPNERVPVKAPMLPHDEVSLAHFPVRSVDQMMKKCAVGLLSRLGTGTQSQYYSKMWKAMTSGAVDLAMVADMARGTLGIDKHAPEAVYGTPTKFAPVAVTAELSYASCGLPALGVILKWIELHMLDDAALRDPIWDLTCWDVAQSAETKMNSL